MNWLRRIWGWMTWEPTFHPSVAPPVPAPKPLLSITTITRRDDLNVLR